MTAIAYRELTPYTTRWLALLAALGAVTLGGLAATWYMEHNGHYVTGMTNQIVWGTPHVFAVFLIVAASGALNVASIASVFNKTAYKPLAPLSGLLAIALLAGGLMVLVLDLGRLDRLMLTMTHLNPKSIFTWNVLLYSGFFGLVAVYLWTVMDRKMKRFYKAAGFAAFLWRLILTTGTGSIFGFLVAREAYNSAVMAPLFIAMSFSFGLAAFILVLMAAMTWTRRPLGAALLNRLRSLLAVFIAAALYFTVVQHLTNLYMAERAGASWFILAQGGVYTFLFWGVQVLLGGILPLALTLNPRCKSRRPSLVLASVLVLVGGLAQVYVIIIGGQAYPLSIFPGYEVISSSFFDGRINEYTPSLPEIALGLGGVAVALLIVMFGSTVLRFLPASLADEVTEPGAE